MNWGYKLVTAGALFITFILLMSFYMLGKRNGDTLVDDDYYEAGINFDRKLEARNKVMHEQMQPSIRIEKSLLLIRLKTAARYELKLLRPSDKRQDKVFTDSTTSGNLIVVPRNNLRSGLWDLELNWNSDGASYSFSKKLRL
ncbi:FixH family protein [Pedobacter sp. SYP-B3415]|uniref:FixH family protein n=1 Tax=Pedobacter sp. SYP-B3415 TaxID=2496641 RepID=UPI00101BA40D|nr:FixH family protein [Pedobacter sp. SYP-B3415]